MSRHCFTTVLAAAFALQGGASRAAEALRICLDENAAPYSVHQKTGDAGFDLAVAAAVAQRLGRTLSVQWFESKIDGDSSAALEANALLSDGRCQLVGGYPLTEDALAKPGSTAAARLPDFDGAKPEDRRRRVALGTLSATIPYHFAPLTIVLGGGAVGKEVKSLDDLDGVNLGVESGTLSDAILSLYRDGRLIENIAHFTPGRGALWPAFERGDFEATLAPLHRFDAYRAAHPDTKLKMSGYLYPLGFNIGFVGLARDGALIVETNAALAEILDSGEVAKLAAPAGTTYLPPRAPDILKHVSNNDLKSP